jgi:hypothetical protein
MVFLAAPIVLGAPARGGDAPANARMSGSTTPARIAECGGFR